MDIIKIGKIVKTIALKGEMKVLVEKSQLERFKNLKEFYIDGFEQKYIAEKTKIFGDKNVLKILAHDDINLVLQFVNREIYIKNEGENKLEDNEFFVDELIGSEIIFNQNVVGVVQDIENFGAGDIIVFKNGKLEQRVPFNMVFFEKIDIENKKLLASQNFYDGVV